MKTIKKSTVKIGTKFHATYMDGNPEWTVTKKLGRDVWEAKVAEDDSDFGGVTQAFLTPLIQHHLSVASSFKRSRKRHEEAYAHMNVGQIVHYHDGFGQFIRCKVVDVDGEKKLKPIHMVGAWDNLDLPRREPSGEVHYPYNARSVIDGAVFKPHSGNIWEFSKDLQKTQRDPRKMDAIDLSVPDQSEEEKSAAVLYAAVRQAREALESVDDLGPRKALQQAQTLIAEALA